MSLGLGRRWVRWSALGICLLMASLAVQAQPRIRAFITPEGDVDEEQTLQLVIQVTVGRGTEVAQPQLPQLVNLRVIDGPERRFDSRWANGQFSSSSQLRYLLLPIKPGPAEVPPISVAIEGETYSTDAIKFDVLKAGTTRPSQPRNPTRPRPDSPQRANVSLEAKLADDEVWVGQSVPLTVELHAADRITNPIWRGRPSLSSFWVEELEVDSEGEAYSLSKGGVRYIVYPLARKVLVPQTPGSFEIDPYALQLQVRSRSSDPLDSFFSFGRGTTIVRKSEPLSLRVRPLPEQGRPDDFSGAVGRFRLTAELDRGEVAANDAVALRATVEGDGFLRAVEPPTFDAPPDMKVFGPEVRATTRTERGVLISRKTWEWILVPMTPGEVLLDDLTFHYFDPQSGAYAESRQTLQPLTVQAGERTVDTPMARGDVRLRQRDLAYIKPLRGSLGESSPRVYGSAGFVALAVLPLLWAPLWVFLGRHRARRLRDGGLIRSRKAGTRARKRLASIEKHGSASGSAEYHEEIARTLVDYVADRFNLAAAGLTYEVADGLLSSKGVDTEIRRRFRSCLERCDFARFVPTSGESERRAEVLDEAKQVIDLLERAS